MAEIIAAIDEGGANRLLVNALTTVGALTAAGSGSLGPFTASYGVSATLAGGVIDLIAPGTVRIDDLRLNWQLDLRLLIDLNRILPSFCLPQVCIDIPCVGRICTPRICISWPTIPVNVSLSDFVEASADLGIDVALNAGNWKVQLVVQSLRELRFGPGTAGLLAAIGLAITPVLLAVPFIGPFLAIAVAGILAAIGIGGITGLLGPILSPFISGLKIPIYDQPQHFLVLPASSATEPDVFIDIDAVTAEIRSSDEDELVLSIDISP